VKTKENNKTKDNKYKSRGERKWTKDEWEELGHS
jgi:hypothetical protein